jgi:hypothetical protein
MSLWTRPATAGVAEFVTVCHVMYVSTRYARPSAPVAVFEGTAFVHGAGEPEQLGR